MYITDKIDLTGIKVTEEGIYRGKANDVLKTDNPEVLAIRSTDRASAGNGAKTAVIEGKGKANHVISVEAFRRIAEESKVDGEPIPTHYLGEDPENCIKYVRKTAPIKLEVIGRWVFTGSFIKAFGVEDGSPVVWPDGKDAPFVEFTFKSDPDGDPRITDYSIIKDGLLSADEVKWVRSATEEIGRVLRYFFNSCDCRLLDYKVEFGRLEDGTIILIDEISADTCRLRDVDTGRKLDKDPFREGEDVEKVGNGYQEIMRRVQALRHHSDT